MLDKKDPNALRPLFDIYQYAAYFTGDYKLMPHYIAPDISPIIESCPESKVQLNVGITIVPQPPLVDAISRIVITF